MKKNVILSPFFILFFGISINHSQNDTVDCPNFDNLIEINKEELINSAKQYLDYIEAEKKGEIKLTRIYCPPTELHFTDNCNFPNHLNNIKFYLGLLYAKADAKLTLSINSDTLEYQKNPNINLKRAETVKKIFSHYGIEEKRISIINLEDKYPIDTNKTKEGRENNKYVTMNVPL